MPATGRLESHGTFNKYRLYHALSTSKAVFCNFSPSLLYIFGIFLQCFDAVGWAAGRVSGLKKLSGEVLA